MRVVVVAAAVVAVIGHPAMAAPATAHILVEQHPEQRGDKVRYVARAQRCKDEFFKELRLADGRAPAPLWVRGPAATTQPNPSISQILDAGDLAGAQVLAAAINVCLEAQGLAGVRAVLSAEPSSDAPLE